MWLAKVVTGSKASNEVLAPRPVPLDGLTMESSLHAIEGLDEGDPTHSFGNVDVRGRATLTDGAVYRFSHWPASARILHSHVHSVEGLRLASASTFVGVGFRVPSLNHGPSAAGQALAPPSTA